MAAVLQGEGTATMSITNGLGLKIQIADGDSLFYQFIDDTNLKAYEIQQVEIEHVDNPDSGEVEMAFYLVNDTKKETPYFISEFVRDNYPAITSWMPKGVAAQGCDLLPDGIGKGLPEGRITEVYGRTSYHK